jgi:hypothetical protein
MHYAFLMNICYTYLTREGLIVKSTSIHSRVKAAVNPLTTAKPGSDILEFHEMLESAGLGHDPKCYLGAMMNVARQRKPFFTSKFYVGMGPAAMSKGDIVCVLYGGRVHYVLRPRQDRYELIGECYVHGLMHGKAIENAQLAGIMPEWFDLR